MAKLIRPYIPRFVRLQVIARQLGLAGKVENPKRDLSMRLRMGLEMLCADLHCTLDELQLDHDPALVNRRYNIKTKKYMPDANDPDFLVYRTKSAHDIKTRVRGDGAQYSDLALRRKLKRSANKDRPIRKIRSRGFAK